MSYANVMNAELAYQKKIEAILSDQNCYKIISYKNSSRLTIELIDTQGDDEDDENDVEVEKWSEYVDKYISAENREFGEDIKEALLKRPVFLTRNAHHLKCKFGVNKQLTSASTTANNNKEAGDSKTDNITASDKEINEAATQQADAIQVEETKQNKNEIEMKSEEAATTANVDVKSEAISYKIKYKTNDTTLMYRRNSLKNSKKVCLILFY
jgi:paired amphipathic helix protein Sin3a